MVPMVLLPPIYTQKKDQGEEDRLATCSYTLCKKKQEQLQQQEEKTITTSFFSLYTHTHTHERYLLELQIGVIQQAEKHMAFILYIIFMTCKTKKNKNEKVIKKQNI